MKPFVQVLGFFFRPLLVLKDHPVLFKFGNVYILTVGIITAIAAVSSLLCAIYFYKIMFPVESSGNYFLWRASVVILFALLFSKIFHFFALGPEFFKNPTKHLAETAYYDQGGQFGMLLGTIWFAFDTQINFFACMDINLTAGYLAFSIGRIGCYNYGCCHGRPVNSQFATTYTNPDSKALRIFPELANVPLAPTQLVSAAFSFALFATMVWTLTLSPPAGLVSAYSIFLYNIFRLYIEQYRISVIDPSEKEAKGKFFRQIAMFILIFGTIYAAYVIWYNPTRLEIVAPMTVAEFFINDVFTIKSIVLLLLISALYIVAWGIHYKKLGQHFEWKST